MSERYYDIVETQFGWMGLLSSEAGLVRSTLPEESEKMCASRLGIEADEAVRAPDRFADLRDRLEYYFDGSDTGFGDIELDFDDAPDFHRRAWQACRTIPRGETRTYKWLAGRAGSPNAPRAAGQTMARNRIPIIVPCHRVIGSDGSLRGFGSGDTRIDLKRRLLELEGAARRLL
ncbi:MAG: MGMT family protein [Dehalococcoidia bacterium]|nr:MGMT family protein [Dehalococcoidia bacterium]